MATATEYLLGDKVWSEYREREDLSLDAQAGTSFALDAAKTRMVAGNSVGSDSGFNRGNVRTYDWNGNDWVEDVSARLFPASGSLNRYGNSVQLSSDGLTLIVAEFQHNYSIRDGRVYTYDWNGGTGVWDERNTITGVAGERVGREISLSDDGNLLLVLEGQVTKYLRVYDRNLAVWDLRYQFNLGDLIVGYSFKLMDMSGDGTRLVALVEYDPEGTFWFADFSMVAGVWQLNSLSPQDVPQYEIYRGFKLSPDCSKIAVCAKGNLTEGMGRGNILLFEYDGEGWIRNQTCIFIAPQVGHSSQDSTSSAAWWMSDTQVIASQFYQVTASLPSFDERMELIYVELGDAPSAADGDIVITGAIRAEYQSASNLIAQKPPVLPYEPWDLTTGQYTSGYEELCGGGISYDGLVFIGPSASLHWCHWWKRESITDVWVEQFPPINCGYWPSPTWDYYDVKEIPWSDDPFGGNYGATSLSGNGKVIVTHVSARPSSFGSIDPDDDPFDSRFNVQGLTENGGVATYLYNEATNSWDFAGIFQDSGYGGNYQGSANGLNEDGTIMWMGTWYGGGTSFARYVWNPELFTWERTGNILVTTSNATYDWKEAYQGSCSADGSKFSLLVYDSTVSTTGGMLTAEWTGAVVQLRGDYFLPFDFGFYAAFLQIDYAGSDGDTIYGYVWQGQDDDYYVAKFGWSGTEWVFDETLKGPFYGYRTPYGWSSMGVAQNETTIALMRSLPDLGYELGDYLYWQLPDGEDDDFLVTYVPPSDTDGCFTKVSNRDRIIQTGSVCVVDYVAPPPVDNDTDPNLPRPPNDVNNPEVTCEQITPETAVWSGISVTNDPEKAKWLLENVENKDLTNGQCN